MHVSPERFEELVAQALDELPDWVHERLDNVEVIVVDRPAGGDRSLLGLYEGIPLTRRGTGYAGVLPDRISIYRENIQRICNGETELRARVKRTVVHEVAHFFGISDDRLREIDRY
jgi:predicted Zn-dependent protease with MMP-like domain